MHPGHGFASGHYLISTAGEVGRDALALHRIDVRSLSQRIANVVRRLRNFFVAALEGERSVQAVKMQALLAAKHGVDSHRKPWVAPLLIAVDRVVAILYLGVKTPTLICADPGLVSLSEDLSCT